MSRTDGRDDAGRSHGSRRTRSFYRLYPNGDGTVDVYLRPAEAVPYFREDDRVDFRFRTMVVRGINPDDPQWGGNLERHVREHYQAWIESSEVIEI